MSFEKYTALSINDVVADLRSDVSKGINEKDAKTLLKKYGPNVIKKDEVTWTQVLLRQFRSAFVYILIAAAVLTFLLGETLDGIFIIVFVGINVALGFLQENKSEQTAKLLRKYTSRRATVIREGTERIIDAGALVPGDIVVIETGAIVPADLRLIKVNDLLIDESALTGESVHVVKQASQHQLEERDTFKADNIAFSGTIVTEGKGVGIVVATGKDSQFGKIAKLATETEEVSAFERNISRFSKFILFLILITLALVFTARLTLKGNSSTIELVIFSIALAVSVIPEAMPLVTTFSLSLGASKLAKKKVIVKRLSAIEDLGGIQILCTDKTGTITENKLTVENIYAKSPSDVLKFGIIAASSIDKKGTATNSFDLAILAKLGKDSESIYEKANIIFELPFSPNRRRNSVLAQVGSKKELIVRGAVEAVMPHIADTSAKDRKLIDWILTEGAEGRRVMVIAKKEFHEDKYEAKDEETKLELVGLLSFVDPIKITTVEAIKKAKSLGVITKIITGDSLEVASAVAVEIGIAENKSDSITGDEFSALPRSKQLETAHRINVFARMSPEQKHYLIKLLQEDFEVGFLGEGINDAPALKAAGVSIVVDNASDVSREVADIILLKHDLKVIMDGIELGRKTFVNVTNYVRATLASNFGNFYAMAFVTLTVDYLPMLPAQILLVNLLSDFPMISIATDNVDRKDTHDPKSYSLKDSLFLATVLGLVSTGFDFLMFSMFKGLGERSMQTYWFIGSILTELVLIYSIRTKGWFINLKTPPSATIFILTITAGIFAVGIPFLPIGSGIFKFIVPATDKLLLIFVVVLGYLLSTEMVKKLYYKFVHASS